MNFGTVAILGPGLIGGSLALALAERGLATRLMIYARSPRALDAIRTAGVDAELTQNPSEAVRDADVVVLCVPIEAMAALVLEFRDVLKPTALVTDVGSVKGSVDLELAPLLEDRALWIGSHPMAGSEQAGFTAARADLFEGATVVLTATKLTPPGAEVLAEKIWRALGAQVVKLTPEAHDKAVAAVSHIPHLLASVLVNHALAHGDLDLAAGGFRDTTRIASGSPELWTEILLANREAVGDQVGYIIHELEQLRRSFQPNRGGETYTKSVDGVSQVMDATTKEAWAKTKLFAFLETAHDARSQLLEKKPNLHKRR